MSIAIAGDKRDEESQSLGEVGCGELSITGDESRFLYAATVLHGMFHTATRSFRGGQSFIRTLGPLGPLVTRAMPVGEISEDARCRIRLVCDRFQRSFPDEAVVAGLPLFSEIA